MGVTFKRTFFKKEKGLFRLKALYVYIKKREIKGFNILPVNSQFCLKYCYLYFDYRKKTLK